nr:MAG TPA: hypothetical protein [Caudoviricetes sp.]
MLQIQLNSFFMFFTSLILLTIITVLLSVSSYYSLVCDSTILLSVGA